MADDLTDKIEQARKAGYSDAEIVGHLSKSDARVAQAMSAGYNPTEIVSHIAPVKKSIFDHIKDTASEVWDSVNPVAAISGMASAASSPIATAKAYGAQNEAIARKAERAFKAGNYAEGLAHSIKYVMNGIPGLGQAAEESTDELAKGNYGTGTGKAIGAALSIALPEKLAAAGVKLPAAAKKVIGRVAEDTYQSALKPPPGSPKVSPADIKQTVRTGLKEQVPVGQVFGMGDNGLDKLGGLLDETNNNIAQGLSARTEAGVKIDPKAIADRIDPLAEKLSKQANPEADVATVGNAKAEFLRKYQKPGEEAPRLISPNDAQETKVATYQQLRSKYGQMGSAQVEAEKALARGAKEEIVKAFPEIADLNLRDSRLMNLETALERAVKRIGNRDTVPIGGTGVSILKAIVDNPGIKSRIAIALDRAAISGKLNVPIGTSRAAQTAARLKAFSDSLDQQQEQQ